MHDPGRSRIEETKPMLAATEASERVAASSVEAKELAAATGGR